MIRLHVDAPLAVAATIQASPEQAHYLGTVMRRGAGDGVLLFNGRDGEWEARITALARGRASLLAEKLRRPQCPEEGHWLLFAPLRRDATDLVVQKATELGAGALLPVITERTNAARLNERRLRAIAIEAAEQSERLTVPALRPARTLEHVLRDWPTGRTLFAALERAGHPPPRAAAAAALLVGPEGGFGPRDLALLRERPPVVPVSLGPRILRAETAAIAGLALLQLAG